MITVWVTNISSNSTSPLAGFPQQSEGSICGSHICYFFRWLRLVKCSLKMPSDLHRRELTVCMIPFKAALSTWTCLLKSWLSWHVDGACLGVWLRRDLLCPDLFHPELFTLQDPSEANGFAYCGYCGWWVRVKVRVKCEKRKQNMTPNEMKNPNQSLFSHKSMLQYSVKNKYYEITQTNPDL